LENARVFFLKIQRLIVKNLKKIFDRLDMDQLVQEN